MILKPVIGLFFLLIAGVSFAQFGVSTERNALRHIDKHRWGKAEIQLRQSLEKNSRNPGTRYVFSLFYFHPGNPAFNLDSAYRYAVTALEAYVASPARERERLNRISTDSLGMIALRAKIDSAAFAEAKEANTEAAYQEFLSHFPSAVQRDLARQLRDEVAFQHALAENTHQRFFEYLERYPDAARAPEARARYERLLYEDETKDHSLASYETFLSDHPETPYREEIHRHIFEISTADGAAESFLDFTTRYPQSAFVKTARRMLFYILWEQDAPRWPAGFVNDSLMNLLAINHTYLVPVLQNDVYGFIDENGNEILSPRFQKIPGDYLCGYITDDLLRVDDRLITRSGSVVYQGSVDEYTDLGIGFIKIQTDEQTRLIHKGGFGVMDSIQDAEILDKRYIAVKKNNAWHLFSLTGRMLSDAPWDSISAFNDVILFSRQQKKYVAPATRVTRSADGLPLRLSEPFDEVKPWPNGLLWGRAGAYQGVLNASLEGVIGFDRHVLTGTFFGAIAAVPNGFVLYNWEGKKSSTFEHVTVSGNCAGVKRNHSWFIFDTRTHAIGGKAYDSLRAEGPFMVGRVADTVDVHFQDKVIPFIRPWAVSFIPGMDSSSFLLVAENAAKKTVFDLYGRRLFTALFDAIEYAGEGVFAVTKRGRKGLVNSAGERLLRTEFDAIGSVKDHVVSILSDKHFGAYSIAYKKFIKPQYDRNLLPYNDQLLTTFKDGYYAFLGWNNRPVSAYEFDEIRYWDDSVALVKKGSYWNFYDIFSRRVIEGNLRKIIMVTSSGPDKVAIVQKGNSYGVISNRRNVIVPVTFSHIINLGSTDEPLYFTEKHIKEASLFIIIYYDRHGNLLRKEIYDDATDYDKIYCSDN